VESSVLRNSKGENRSDKLNQKIADFVALAKECPDNLQEFFFALSLEDFGQQNRSKRQARDPK
jgi:hypothetical protein